MKNQSHTSLKSRLKNIFENRPNEISKDDLWDRVSSNLDEDKRRPKIVYWFLPLLLAFGVFGIFIYQAQFSTQEITNQVPTTHASHTKLESGKYDSKSVDQTIINSSFTDPIVLEETNLKPTIEILESSQEKNLEKLAIQPEGINLEILSSEHRIVESLMHSSEAHSSHQTDNSQPLQLWEEKTSFENPSFNPNQVVVHQYLPSNVSELPVNLNRAIDENLVSLKKPVHKDKLNQWEIEIAAGVSLGSLHSSNSDEVKRKNINEATTYRYGQNYGLGIQRNFKDGWSIYAGLSYRKSSHKLDWTKEQRELGTTFSDSANYFTYMGVTTFTPGMLPTETVTTHHIRHFNTYQQINVPIRIGYRLKSRGAMGLQVHAGYALNVYSSFEGRSFNEATEEILSTEDSPKLFKKGGVNTMQIGGEVWWNFRESTVIGFRIEAQYSSNSFKRQSSLSMRKATSQIGIFAKRSLN